ncbi:MAG: transaldolase family protein [Ferruginibacter sp.]
MNNLKTIHSLGQSIWLDFFGREIMNNGKLQRLIGEDGLSGITPNPSIFEKAVTRSSDYDDDINRMSAEQKSMKKYFLVLQSMILNVRQIY